jgi:hypothetical protein
MPRCEPPTAGPIGVVARRKLPTLALLAGLFAAAAAPAGAQAPRNFPATALRGELVIVQPPQVLLNRRPAQLAPGARIRGSNNMLQMSGELVNQRLLVHYTLDIVGNLHEVWVLTPAELARQPWPMTPQQAQAWQFNPDMQTWTPR